MVYKYAPTEIESLFNKAFLLMNSQAALPESENYETLGGFIVNHTEEIPEQNQEIIIEQFHFTIKEVSNTKIELVQLKILEDF